jgi:hypothetical protein
VFQELSHRSPVLSWCIGIEPRFVRILDSNFRMTSERIKEKSEII